MTLLLHFTILHVIMYQHNDTCIHHVALRPTIYYVVVKMHNYNFFLFTRYLCPGTIRVVGAPLLKSSTILCHL